MKPRVRKAVFPVAGLGTRFLPATKVMPKEMLPVVDRPLIQYAVEEARAAGIEEFIFVTGRGKSMIEDHFDIAFELQRVLEARSKTAELEALEAWRPRAGQVSYTRQMEPLGLGHAVWCARHLVGEEPFAVILPDDLYLAETPCLRQMVEAYAEVGGNLLAAERVPREHISRYGILDVTAESGRLAAAKGLVEKPSPEQAPSDLAVVGRYILVPEVFAFLDRQQAGAGGEIQLTDAIAHLVGDVPLHGLWIEGRRFDCGDKSGYLQANVAFALQRDDTAPSLRAFLDALDR